MSDDGLSAPDSKSGKLQRIVLELMREHAADGALPTSSRFLFYELEQRGVLSKEKKSGRRPDQNLHDATTRLREVGLVPWEWLADETRSLSDYSGWNSVASGVAAAVPYTRLDPWGGRAPLVITESRSLAGVLRALAVEYAVKLAPTNGQVGGFLHTELAPALTRDGRVLYVGDFDWQGGQIEANTRSVLERLVGDLDWRRIALTEQQVLDYDLARWKIRKPDHRYKPVRYHDAVECEALKQNVIVGIIREALEALLPEPLEHVLEREQEQRTRIAEALDGLRKRSK